jgi:hypothetical protein
MTALVHRCWCCDDTFPCCDGAPVVCPGSPWDRALCRDCERGHCSRCDTDRLPVLWATCDRAVSETVVTVPLVERWLTGPAGPMLVNAQQDQELADAATAFFRMYDSGYMPDQAVERFREYGVVVMKHGAYWG